VRPYTSQNYYREYLERCDPVGKQTDKGTRAESAVVTWAKSNGFWDSDRLTKTGALDRGDVRIKDRVMVQVKDGYTTREPTDFMIGQWLEAVDKQQRHGQWEIALLVHKKPGHTNPDMWRWYVTGRTFARLVEASPRDMPQYIQLQGYMIPPLLKGAGY
jgi:hypothetical protein